MTAETKAPEGMPIETPASSGALFDFGRAARRRGDADTACPYSLAFNRERWREGWRFENGLIQSQQALAAFEHATAKETVMK